MSSRSYLVGLSLIVLLALTACGGTAESDPTQTVPTAQPPEATEVAPPEATATPEDYPAPPTATSLPEGYPAPTEAAPPTAYPAGMMVWMLRPLGQQCEDSSTYLYQDLTEAVDALEAEGIAVLASEMVSLMVCEACTCPTSEHFRVQISAQDMAAAEALGWRRE